MPKGNALDHLIEQFEAGSEDVGSAQIHNEMRAKIIEFQIELDRMLRALTAADACDAKLEQRASYDYLTGLPNRFLFERRFGEALDKGKRHDETLDLAILDFNGFKAVNDTHGHPTGDKILILGASRLTRCVRENDTVARLGGDEFAILLPQQMDDAIGIDVTERVKAAFNEPFDLPGCGLVSVGVSVGVANYPRDADNAEKLMLGADLAMYQAKRGGTGTKHHDGYRNVMASQG